MGQGRCSYTGKMSDVSALCLPHNILGFLTHRLLKSFTGRAICGMNRGNRCSYSSFPFPHYYPDTGTGSEHLNRTCVVSPAQPLSKQTSRLLTPLHTLSPTHSLLRASI